MDDWHFRLGHLSKDKLSVLSIKFDYISSKTYDDFCQICPLVKHKGLPFPVSTSSSNKIFYLLHMDIWGPLAITFVDGHKYFFDYYGWFYRRTWIFLLKNKSEVQGCIKSFINLVETQFSTTVKCIKDLNLICISFTLSKA